MVDLVLVGVAVPPAPVGPRALHDVRGAAGGFRFEGLGLLDDRLPRISLRPLPCNTPGVSRKGYPGLCGLLGRVFVPDLGRSAPGVRLRALTLPGCPRMLQVALRACAPQT
ncbi:hypothetical protein FNH09_41620 [Streptomyces adustus]|uniref:Uncharacterized protein n=1 Tax=Streptomyces adustus TaxID=1609272 RepID=A0A5N8VQB3_9ACTN|nr:hypothetical protein [Streptomyces adustus]